MAPHSWQTAIVAVAVLSAIAKNVMGEEWL
jgi:hypothetical protein